MSISSALWLGGQRQDHSLHATRRRPSPRSSLVRCTGTCTLSFEFPSPDQWMYHPLSRASAGHKPAFPGRAPGKAPIASISTPSTSPALETPCNGAVFNKLIRSVMSAWMVALTSCGRSLISRCRVCHRAVQQCRDRFGKEISCIWYRAVF